jgi:hypothetical protein
MKMYDNVLEYCISADDAKYLELQGYKNIPSPEVVYKVSSENNHDYALYLIDGDKWKHSSSITNKLLLSIFDTLKLRGRQIPEIPKEIQAPEELEIFTIGEGKTLPYQTEPKKEDSGFSCDYYRVGITHPMTKEQIPYIAECGDIMEALNMTYAEANMFKAIWRTAAARTLGLEKAGNTTLRDAEKIKFFAERHHLRESVNANNTDERIVRKNK